MITIFELTIIVIVEILILGLIKILYEDSKVKKEKKSKKQSWKSGL